MDWLFAFYISTTIFGVGITVIDLLGLIGHQADQGEGSDHSGDHSGDHDADDGGGHDFGHDGHDDGYDGGQDGHDDGYDMGHDGHDDGSDGGHDGHDDGYDGGHDGHDGGHNGHDVSHELDHVGDHGHDLQHHGETQESVVVHDHTHQRRNPVIFLLSLARSLVYFCLGFGPVGWFALATGIDKWISLAWSIPFGLVTVFGTRAVRRIMRRDLDSQVKESQLLMEKAEVLVSINKGQLGKVRVRLGDTYIERYARAKDREKSFPVGSVVTVIDVTEDSVLIDDET